jgi:hypothetical protein
MKKLPLIRNGVKMKSFSAFCLSVLLTAIVLSSASSVLAGPIMPKDIGADAKWFGHFDCEALRSMELVKNLKDKCPMQQQCQAKMEILAEKLGMNPMEDILGVTLYSTRYDGQVGVGLIYVKKLDRKKMASLLAEKHPDHKTIEYGSHTLHMWTVDHQEKKMDMTGTFATDNLIVIGVDADQVKLALDVLDGKKPCLTEDAPLLKDIAKNALFACRAIDVPETYSKNGRCVVLQNCKAATVVWKEANGQITGNYEFTTDSEEAAKNFKAMVDGFKAMAELHHGNIPAIKKILNDLQCNAKGDMFTAAFTASEGDVEAAIKALIDSNACPMFKMLHDRKKCETINK